ncbi:MAG: energy transducer TonB, partial [Verrucomicrobiota bacterium]|nr:energy transducer TonB [Verrucomicrobiota bacterium]
RSLVNLIDEAGLVKHGQGDAIVLFSCFVNTIGDGYFPHVYRSTPGSELLKHEIIARINMAQFEPAVYRHVNQFVYLCGTVIFRVVDGKPHLRIFLNQEEDVLKRGEDFIAPQMMFTLAGTKFKDIYWPPNAPGHEGVASVALGVDATGKVTSVKVTYEHPAGMGFGAAVAGPIRDADFIPGYRKGQPVACHFDLPFIFFGPGLQMKTG